MQMLNRVIPSEHTYDLCIMGGGAVGMVAMLLAHQQGLSAIQLLPQAGAALRSKPTASAVPRTYAIAPQVQAQLAAIGVWGLLANRQIMRCDDMRVFWQYANDNSALVHFDAAAAGMPQLCSFVAEDDLNQALATALHAALQNSQPSSQPTRVKQTQYHFSPAQQPTVTTTDAGVTVKVTGVNTIGQPTITAKLCIVAEGANSPTAASLGLAPTVFDYAHSAVVAVLHSDASSPASPHTAWQWLGDAAHGHDVLALLPLPPTALNAQQSAPRYGLVWSQPKTQAHGWLGRETDLLAAVNARCAGAVGQLSLHSAVQQFPLFQSTAPRYTAAHVALVGDTAHKIHPLAGQGLNLGFEDVFALFDVLAQREPWRSVSDPRLLARYERQRRAHANPVSHAIHTIARRGDWPALAQKAWHKALRMSNDWPLLGAWAAGRVTQRMAREKSL